MKSLLLVLGTAAVALAGRFDAYPNGSPAHNVELARYINSLRTTWVASETPSALFANRTHEQAKRLMGTFRGGPKLTRKTWGDLPNTATSFDARTAWPNCLTIPVIRDQSNCGSCWAFGAAESISDRLCTYLGASNPAMRNVAISSNDLNSCCDSCGFGCGGGFPEAAWQYYVDTGLTTNNCDPYPLPKCEHHIPKNHYPVCSSTIADTPPCPTQCKDGSPFSGATRYFGSTVYSVEGVNDYMTELQKNGPFEVTFNVYQDFEAYRSGVYQHVTGPLLGGHAVKLVGWGTDNGTPYWTIANSWNSDWGEQGFFRIIRGQNECGIEESGTAGAPKSS
jgi:hypothetical protein